MLQVRAGHLIRYSVVTCTQCTLIALMLMMLLSPVSARCEVRSSPAITCDRTEGALAIPYCRQALLETPQDVNLLVVYTDILLDLGRPLEAVELLETGLGKNPDNNTIRLKLSNAKEAAEKPLQDSGPSSRAIERLNLLQCKTRTGQAALSSCNIALQQRPRDVELLMAKGDALMVLKRPTDATRTYELALAEDESNTAIQSKLKLALAEVTREQTPPTPTQMVLQNEPMEKDPVEVAVAKEIKSVVKFSNASIDGQVSY
jgi:tetratricopeptide (TPR) repeat protein